MSVSIIIALDFASKEAALNLIEQLDPKACRLKIGHEMFTAFGFSFVKQVMGMGFDVFLDLKFHDIPNTVAAACKKVAEHNVWMTNVHGLGGLKMMQAAQQAIESVGSNTQLIAVTVLTSHGAEDLPAFGLTEPVTTHVQQLAGLAELAGLKGIVCSAQDIQALPKSERVYVTPGIRPTWAASGDQSRIMTPVAAQAAGSSHLVIGRPITASTDPMGALNKIQQELKSVN